MSEKVSNDSSIKSMNTCVPRIALIDLDINSDQEFDENNNQFFNNKSLNLFPLFIK